MTTPLFAGAVLGLSIAAPFGPVSLLCVQQSLNLGYRPGFAIGCGASTAHGAFASIAIASAGVTSAVLAPDATAIRLLSALILVCLGVRMLLRARSLDSLSQPVGPHAAYASGLMLSLSNPLTIIPYLALATAAATERSAGASLSLWSIPGVVLGAFTWYATLSFATSLLRRGVPKGMTRFLNLLGGCTFIGFGANIGREVFWAISV
ncbi:MAG: LysE family transporter [Alphaproteobacteria bacterium]|nr:LysE family transporter [Alphaproteobacteria bacterium]